MDKLQKINLIGTILQNEDEALTNAVFNVLKNMEVRENERREGVLHQYDSRVVTIFKVRPTKKAIFSNKKTSSLIP